VNALSLYRLEIHPRVGESPRACAEEVCTHFSKFMVDYYRELDREVFPLHFDGRADQPDKGHRLVAARLVCAQHTLATVDWQITLPEDRYYTWRIAFACATDRQSVELQYQAGFGLSTLLVTPGKTEMKIQLDLIMPVKFLSSVLGMRTATIDGTPVPVAIEFLGPNDVNTYVDRILLNPKRVLPVILLAADGRFKSTPDGMQNLQHHLLGTAHLAALTSPAATERLERCLGASLACSEGVLRVYYPLLTRQSPARDHPVFHSKYFLGKKLEPALHILAMKFLAQRVPDGPVVSAARAAVCGELSNYSEQLPSLMTRLASTEEKLGRAEAQRDRIHADRDEARKSLRLMEGKLAEQVRSNVAQANELQAMGVKLELCEKQLSKLLTEHGNTLEQLRDKEESLVQVQRHLEILRGQRVAEQSETEIVGTSELEAELDQAWRENDQSTAELETLRQELAAVNAELAVCKKNLDILAAATADSRPLSEIAPSVMPIPSVPISVAEALGLASERHGDVLEVWEDAWKSAMASHFPGATRVAEALKAIAEIGRSYFSALREGHSLGPLDQAFRQRIPFKYAPCESEMTMAMYGQQRLFHDGAQRREIQRHLTLGGRGNCLQVYFDFDEANGKVIIAYCGQHLSHYRQT
jgi:hypothetical protein